MILGATGMECNHFLDPLAKASRKDGGNEVLRVRYELDRLGMTQASLAEKARVNEASLSRIVNGKEQAYPKRGQRIADALGWQGTLQELFGELEVK